jgi:hypothetical protein
MAKGLTIAPDDGASRVHEYPLGLYDPNDPAVYIGGWLALAESSSVAVGADSKAAVSDWKTVPSSLRGDGQDLQFRAYDNTEGDNLVYFDDARGEIQ